MATPINPAGTASQVVNIAPAERAPQRERAEPERVEETRAAEPSPAPRRETPESDSNLGNNVDTTA